MGCIRFTTQSRNSKWLCWRFMLRRVYNIYKYSGHSNSALNVASWAQSDALEARGFLVRIPSSQPSTGKPYAWEWIRFSRHSPNWRVVHNFRKQLVQNIEKVRGKETSPRPAGEWGFIITRQAWILLAIGEWLTAPLHMLHQMRQLVR
jgi:hypothetical protein